MKRAVFKWIKDSLMGVGTGLLAAGFVAAVTPGTPPLLIATTLVVGVGMMVAVLVVSLITEANAP